MTLPRYNQCVLTGEDIPFVCDACCWTSLPFPCDDVGDDAAEEAEEAGVRQAPAASSSDQVKLPSLDALSDILSLKGLLFLHSNVRSLLPKIPELHHFLARSRAAVFVASETWLDSSVNDGEAAVPGFQIIRRDRNRNGGGVAVYIRNDIAFNVRPDLEVDDLEATWVEILLPKTKGILVCGCYRPPSDSSFISKLEQSLSKIGPGGEFFVMGDMNMDLNKGSSLLN